MTSKDQKEMAIPQWTEFLRSLMSAAPRDIDPAVAQAWSDRIGLMRATLSRALRSGPPIAFDHHYRAEFTAPKVDTVEVLRTIANFRTLVPDIDAAFTADAAKMLSWKRQLIHELRAADDKTERRRLKPYIFWRDQLPWTTEAMLTQGESCRFEPATPAELIACCAYHSTEPSREHRLVSLVPIRMLNDNYYLVKSSWPPNNGWYLEKESVKPWSRDDQALFINRRTD